MTVPKPPSKVEGSPAPEAGRRVLIKGQQTKAVIIDAALGLASQIGLEGLSIGAVAEVTGMSKSGVFAHFGSREELQISVIREYHDRFEAEVFYAAMQKPRGLPRLQALLSEAEQRLQAGTLDARELAALEAGFAQSVERTLVHAAPLAAPLLARRKHSQRPGRPLQHPHPHQLLLLDTSYQLTPSPISVIVSRCPSAASPARYVVPVSIRLIVLLLLLTSSRSSSSHQRWLAMHCPACQRLSH